MSDNVGLELIQKHIKKYSKLKLLYKLIQNAFKECSKSKSNKMSVILDFKNEVYGVADSGNGLPMKLKDIELDAPIYLATKDFDENEINYNTINLSVINALSTKLIIHTNKHSKSFKYTFQKDKVDKEILDSTRDKYSTLIMFYPEKELKNNVAYEILEKEFKKIVISKPDMEITVILKSLDGETKKFIYELSEKEKPKEKTKKKLKEKKIRVIKEKKIKQTFSLFNEGKCSYWMADKIVVKDEEGKVLLSYTFKVPQNRVNKRNIGDPFSVAGVKYTIKDIILNEKDLCFIVEPFIEEVVVVKEKKTKRV